MNQHDTDRIARVMGKHEPSAAQREWRVRVRLCRLVFRLTAGLEPHERLKERCERLRLVPAAVVEWFTQDQPAREARRRAGELNHQLGRELPHRHPLTAPVGGAYVMRRSFHPVFVCWLVGGQQWWRPMRAIIGTRGSAPALTPDETRDRIAAHYRAGRFLDIRPVGVSRYEVQP